MAVAALQGKKNGEGGAEARAPAKLPSCPSVNTRRFENPWRRCPVLHLPVGAPSVLDGCRCLTPHRFSDASIVLVPLFRLARSPPVPQRQPRSAPGTGSQSSGFVPQPRAGGTRQRFDTRPSPGVWALAQVLFPPFSASAAGNVFSLPAAEPHPFLAALLLCGRTVVTRCHHGSFARVLLQQRRPRSPDRTYKRAVWRKSQTGQSGAGQGRGLRAGGRLLRELRLPGAAGMGRAVVQLGLAHLTGSSLPCCSFRWGCDSEEHLAG